MIHHDVLQGSTEWVRCRLALPTASCFGKIITPAKLQPSKQAEEYMDELLAEWVLGEPIEGFEGTPYMKNGLDKEEEAASWFAFDSGFAVATCGFCTTDGREMGASPDRLVDDHSLLEVKVPSAKTHMKYRRKPDALLTAYRLQVYGQMLVTGRRTCWLLSYSPRIRSVLLKVEWDDEIIGKIREAVTAFVADLDARKQAEDPEKWASQGR